MNKAIPNIKKYKNRYLKAFPKNERFPFWILKHSILDSFFQKF